MDENDADQLRDSSDERNDDNTRRNSEEIQVMNGDVIDQLALACDSITKRALSCRTFGTIASQQLRMIRNGKEKDDVAASIHHEQVKEAWLERQIEDYRIRLAALQYQTDSEGGTRNFTPEETKRMHGEIVDESARIKQERMLFRRIGMVMPALNAILPPKEDDPEHETSHRLLLKHSLRERDVKANGVLDTSRGLEQLKLETQEVMEEFLQLQKKNSALTDELQIQRRVEMDSGSIAQRQNTPDQSTMAKENLILRRVLLDMIVEGKLDWYSDERLRTTLLKLEQN